MDSVSELNSTTIINNNKHNLPTVYYGVFVPNAAINNGASFVFEDKESALKLVKKQKRSRFKSFQFYHEAVDFSLNGAEVNNSAVEEENTKDYVGEKSSPFRTPRPQELTEFRSKIECGNLNIVQEMINDNPRYLVSSGDTPSILQEGARLNALHVAAKANHSDIVEFILNTISKPDFVKRLYGDENQENAEERCRMLLDLYLNTPNKGFNDTPLHIASKWGADKVAEILLSYPECDKLKRNKHNKLPEDVICERVNSKTTEILKSKMEQLLFDNYYVPLLRSEDNTLPPFVGTPFSPTSPPVLNKDPLSPRLEIHAFAGPMDRKEAETFRRAWKTPPRTLNFNSPNSQKQPLDCLSSQRLKDPEKGLERIGKKLANTYNFIWKEYWEFLDAFVDVSSEEGLEMLENHLRNKEKHFREPFEVFSNLMTKKRESVSPITSLCNAFSACSIQINEEKSEVDLLELNRPLIYVDKACQVFANRIFTNITTNLKDSQDMFKLLETDIKLLELLVNSYMTDERFNEIVNFQKVHPRLAVLITKKLEANYKNCDCVLDKIETILNNLFKRSDISSSDDEGPNFFRKPTEYHKQVICLLSRIKNSIDLNLADLKNNDKQVSDDNNLFWKFLRACNCIFHNKKPKRNSTRNWNKSYSFKKKSNKRSLQQVSKRLFDSQFDEENGDLFFNRDENSDEEFFTPLSSPTELSSADSDSEDQFSDAQPPKLEIFLEGAYPTKTDFAVFKALKYAECDIDLVKFPSVYKWHHSINLFTESERESWLRTVCSSDSPQEETPTVTNSWLRITGLNSPKSVFNNKSKF